ncbi:hypothetical protein TW85_06270 [Marinomonas sp. S3726]|nr:hypothetical protein TW85_06270 [Marinomonas sp. S3726]
MVPDSEEVVALLKADVAKKKKAAISRLVKTKHLSQGYPLINRKAYSEALSLLKDKIASHDGSICKRFMTMFGPYVDIEADRKILKLLTNPDAIKDYVPKETKERMESGDKLTPRDKFLIRNSRYKLKVLFMEFEKMKVAQAQLVELSKDIASVYGGVISKPPGAYHGLKSFSGALDKITLRDRSSDYGDLKDVARMSVEFDTIDAMTAAANYLEGSKEFHELKSFQKSLKDRYKPKGEDPHHCGATAEGYQDIKFFLKMDNGILGELQLNTKSMLVAKSKAHHIYDLTRAAKVDAAGNGKITSQELIDHAVKAFDDKWFSFVSPRISGASAQLLDIKNMVKRMGSSGSSFTITAKELASLKLVSCKIYGEIGPPSTIAPLLDRLT